VEESSKLKRKSETIWGSPRRKGRIHDQLLNLGGAEPVSCSERLAGSGREAGRAYGFLNKLLVPRVQREGLLLRRSLRTWTSLGASSRGLGRMPVVAAWLECWRPVLVAVNRSARCFLSERQSGRDLITAEVVTTPPRE